MFNRVRGKSGAGMSLAVAALCAFTLSSAEQLSVSDSASFQIDNLFMQYITPNTLPPTATLILRSSRLRPTLTPSILWVGLGKKLEVVLLLES